MSDGKNVARGGKCVEIEQRIRVGLRARQLEGKAAVWRDLIRYEHRSKPLSAEPHKLSVFGITRELSHLQNPAGSMIILCFSFFDTVRGSRHPAEILGKPALHLIPYVTRKRFRAFQRRSGARHLNKMHSINDSNAPAGSPPVNRLCKFEIRIHTRCFVNKPGT